MIGRGVPRFVKVIAVGIAVGLVVVLVAAWEISNLREAEERRDCERSVGYRNDTRTMWLFALDLSDPETPAERRRRELFVIELDERIPELRCVDGNPVPVDEEP